MGDKILVIDDSQINRVLLGEILDLKDYNYDLCDSVKSALELFEIGKYKLTLMDIQMPEISGIEGIKLLRELEPTCNVIAVTANAFPDDIKQYKQVGFNNIIIKPYKIKDLLETINEVMTCQ